jgi:hypothetical protein
VTAIPGWYADPAGSDELRYFDGQQWAATTAPRPVPARVQTAPASRVALAGQTLAARPRPPRGEPFYKKPKVLAGIAAVAALAVAGAIFVPDLLKDDDTATATPAATAQTPQSTVKHVVLKLPGTVNGWPKLSDAQTGGDTDSMRRSLSRISSHVVVAEYRQPGTDNGALVAVTEASVPASRQKALVDGMLSTLPTSKITVSRQPSAQYGGYTACGTGAEDGQRIAFCAFADPYALGIIAIIGTGSAGPADVFQLRTKVETLAAGPAPSGLTAGGQYAKSDVTVIGKEVAAYYVDGTQPLAASTQGDKYVLSGPDGTTYDSGSLSPGDAIDPSTRIDGGDSWCVAVASSDGVVFSYSSDAGLRQGRCPATGRAPTTTGDQIPA